MTPAERLLKWCEDKAAFGPLGSSFDDTCNGLREAMVVALEALIKKGEKSGGTC